MTRILIAAAATLAFATPATAQDHETVHFTRDGMTYDYTVVRGDEATTYEGVATASEDSNLPARSKFRFIERRGLVTGYVDDTSVSFAVPKRKVARAVAETARN